MSTAARKPQYAQVAEHLIGAIDEGLYRPGMMLPTETDLCTRFGVSRITVRAAMRELALRGLVSRRPGIGTRVEARQSAERFVHSVSTVEDFVQSLVALTFRTLKSKPVIAEDLLAHHTGFTPGQALRYVESMRVDRKGTPIIFSEHWLSELHAAAAEAMDGRRGSLASRIAQSIGQEIGEVRQLIDAVKLGKRTAKLLHEEAGQPALLTERRYISAGAQLLLASRSVAVGGRAPYESRIRRERHAPAATSDIFSSA